MSHNVNQPDADARYYLTALGVINALGANKEEVLRNLLAGSQAGIVKDDSLMLDSSVYVGKVEAPLPAIDAELSSFNCRNNQLLLAALAQIATQVERLIARLGPKRIGVVLGTSTSGIDEGERAISALRAGAGMPESFHYKSQEIGSAAEFLASTLSLQNVAITVSTACSSSAKAFTKARNLIHSGICDAVLVGGVDSLCQLTVNGFNSLELVSASICKPFSANRDGITIGEAAALFILEKEGSEILEKAPSEASPAIQLCGVGEACDAYHISTPDPKGLGAEKAIRNALENSTLDFADIDYINLHGTGTSKNDEMESHLIDRLFSSVTPCSSTKGMTGHTLGAAGASEIALCWLCLSYLNTERGLPPQVWDNVPDPVLPELNMVRQGDRLQDKARHFFMSNSFAFGGSNASVIIGTAPE